jgi:hypothetical protein
MVETVGDGGKRTQKVRVKKPRYIKAPKEPVVLGKRGSFKCQYCEKTYSTEKIVTTHMCEQRRRFQQRDTVFARLGYEAFVALQQMFFGKNRKDSEENFRKSDFYLACVRWGHFVVDINSMNARQYLSWLIKMNVPIDKWNTDEIYDCFLQYYVFVEDPWDAFERNIKKIAEWGEEVGKPYKDYFKLAGTARILTDVRSGAISGWVVFNSFGGRTWLSSLDQGDLELVWAWLDPSRWKIRLENMHDEAKEITNMCNQSGL